MASKTPNSKPSAKSAATRAAAKPAPALKVVEEAGEDEPSKAAGVKLKDIVDRVVETSGVKRKEVRPVIEAALVEIDKALARGDTLLLPGLGKLRVVRTAAEGNGAMTLKLRKPGAGETKAKSDKEALAAEED